MPRLTDTTRAQRRQHILTSAWKCFSRNGFHVTTMDEVIAETGMSSSAVYRYFRSKEEIIHATAEEGVARVRGIFVALLDRCPCPTPTETLTHVVAELRNRTDNQEYDLTRIALQTWAEALRDPMLHKRTRRLYLDTLDHIAQLAARWREDGYIPADADTRAVAATLFSLMHGLLVMHHLVTDVSPEALRSGVAMLGNAVDLNQPLTTAHPKARL